MFWTLGLLGTLGGAIRGTRHWDRPHPVLTGGCAGFAVGFVTAGLLSIMLAEATLGH